MNEPPVKVAVILDVWAWSDRDERAIMNHVWDLMERGQAPDTGATWKMRELRFEKPPRPGSAAS